MALDVALGVAVYLGVVALLRVACTAWTLVKVAGASALMGAVVLLVMRVGPATPFLRHSSLLQFACAGVAGIVIYVAALFVLRVEEVGLLWRVARRRLAPRAA